MATLEPKQILKHIIDNRRTVVPEIMNGKIIPKGEILEILEAANWAPTHGHTEPWRFVVFTPETKDAFKLYHAELYKKISTEKGDFLQVNYDKLKGRAQNASHVVAIINKRGDNLKIPEIEEIAATATAVQNILLSAFARNIACYWGSGGMTYHPEMREHLGFGENDKVMGLLFLGYTDEKDIKGKRRTEINEKTTWINK